MLGSDIEESHVDCAFVMPSKLSAILKKTLSNTASSPTTKESLRQSRPENGGLDARCGLPTPLRLGVSKFVKTLADSSASV